MDGLFMKSEVVVLIPRAKKNPDYGQSRQHPTPGPFTPTRRMDAKTAA